MFKNNRPRYWVDWYDRWHLVVALAFLLLLLVALWVSCRNPLRATQLDHASGINVAGQSLQNLTGQAQPNSVVKIFANEKLVGETTADANGNFALALSPLAPGAYQFKAVADVAGILVESPPVALTIIQPALTPDAPATAVALANSNATATANAQAERNANATATANEKATADAATTASANASNTANATATENAAATEVENATASAQATRAANETAAAKDRNSTATANAPTRAQAEPTAIEQNAATATAATNVAAAQATAAPIPQNVSTATAEPTIAPSETTDAPVIQQPPDGANLLQGALGLLAGVAGGGAPPVTLKIYDGERLLGETKSDAQGKWVFTLPDLAPGAHVLIVKRLDAQGGEIASAPARITVTAVVTRRERPSIELADKSAPLTANTAIVVRGKGEPDSAVQVVEGNTLLGEAKTDAQGNWTLTLAVLAAGRHSLVARQLDKENKPVAVSDPLDLTLAPAPQTIEETRPTIQIETTVVAPLLVLQGRAAPNAKIRVYDGDQLIGETQADADGMWALDLTEPITSGEHSFSAAAVEGDQEIARSETVKVSIAQPLRIGKPAGGELVPGATISGTGAPGATITISADGQVLGTTIVDQNGAWSFVLPKDVKTGIVEFQAEQSSPADSVSVSIHVAAGALPTGGTVPPERARVLAFVALGAALAALGTLLLRRSLLER